MKRLPKKFFYRKLKRFKQAEAENTILKNSNSVQWWEILPTNANTLMIFEELPLIEM